MAYSFSVNDFKNKLQGGGARSTLFTVQLFSPPGISLDFSKVPFLVRTASIPESTLGLITIPYFGRNIKMAGDREFQPWSVTVINDEDFAIRNALESWSNAINQHVGNLRLLGESALNYKADAIVTQYDKAGNTLRQYRFSGLYPQSIQSIALDWSDANRIEEFQVTFEYDYWTIDPTGTSKPLTGTQ
jgi:hypothetical protein